MIYSPANKETMDRISQREKELAKSYLEYGDESALAKIHPRVRDVYVRLKKKRGEMK
jgi:hypothetical protein